MLVSLHVSQLDFIYLFSKSTELIEVIVTMIIPNGCNIIGLRIIIFHSPDGRRRRRSWKNVLNV